MNQEQIKAVLQYDALTGIFRWRFGGRSRAGKKQPWAIAGTPHNQGYVQISINRTRYLAHRLAWMYVHGEWPKHCLDHINGVRSDNRIENLRDVTHQVNAQNQRAVGKRNTSGLMGVGWRKDRQKWRATITLNQKQKFLGVFDTAGQAHEAYLNAKRQFHEGNTL